MITTWLAILWSASVRGGIALLIAWALCQIPRVPATVRCWAWRAAYAVLMISLIWTTPVKLPLLRAVNVLSPSPGTPGEGRGEGAFDNQAAFAEPNHPHPNPLPEYRERGPESAVHADGGKTEPAISSHRPWPIIALAFWLAFAIAYAVRLVIGWFIALRLRNGKPIDHFPGLIDLCRMMKIAQPPAVRTHLTIRGPMLIGVLRPTIILPESMFESPHLRMILAHELAHLKRLDLLWNWLPTLAMAMLPFHPLVWICNRQWRLATEAACDAEAMAATAIDPADYGRVLINVAITFPSQGVLAVAVAAESRWLLKQRLSAMANITRWNRRRLITTGLIVGIFSFAAAVPWRVVAQQPVPAGGGAAVEKAPSTAPAVAGAADPLTQLKEKRMHEMVAATSATADSAPFTVTLGRISMPSAVMRSLTSGTVVRVPCTAGQAVKKGDLLIELDSKAQDAALKSANDILATSDARSKEVAEFFKHGLSTNLDVLQAKLEVDKARDTVRQRQNDLDQTRILAPIDGVISFLHPSVGSTMLPGDRIAVVIDTTNPTVEFSIPQDQARGVKVGSAIEIASREDKTIGRGKVTVAGADVDPETGTMRFQAKLTSTDRGFIAAASGQGGAGGAVSGELVNVRFHSGE